MNIIYAETFFNDVLLNSQYSDSAYRNEQNPTYIKTMGFYTSGDGGAAVYKVVNNQFTTDWVNDRDYNQVTKKNSTENDIVFYFGQGYLWQYNLDYAFQLVPQNDKVIAEQIGILPNDEGFARFNRRLINVGFYYTTQNGYVFEFSAGKTYYITPYVILLHSNTVIEGNNAQIKVIEYDSGQQDIFQCQNSRDNILIRNLNIKGRIVKIPKKVKDEETNEETMVEVDGNEDNAFHCCVKNFVLRNVNVDWFSYAFHSFTQNNASSGDDSEFFVPEIINKNWLIDNCTVNNTGMGLNISEIDGIIIKNSRIYSQLSVDDRDHNLYLSSNCSNIRVNNTTLGHVNGGAIHKHYALDNEPYLADISRNQFYTDIVMHDADHCMKFGLISENIISDSILATQINRLLGLSSSWNCIISNCNLSQTRHIANLDDASTFIYAENASHFWMQNSDVYYIGSHRTTKELNNESYYKKMCEEYPGSKRAFIGENKDIASFWFKFTGCNFGSTFTELEEYFNGFNDCKVKLGEFFDNCILSFNPSQEVFRFSEINSLLSGLTLRNCYMTNKNSESSQPPFVFLCTFPVATDECEVAKCPLQVTRGCELYKKGKSFPWLHFENNIYNSFGYLNRTSWYYYLKTSLPDGSTHYRPTNNQTGTFIGAYSSNCFRINNNKIVAMDDLMKNAQLPNADS
ncbi:MAG: hypothetical protein IJA02_00855 [Clostridia bacterium]|nr:hypothetical protein [Clostridia bacterium]